MDKKICTVIEIWAIDKIESVHVHLGLQAWLQNQAILFFDK